MSIHHPRKRRTKLCSHKTWRQTYASQILQQDTKYNIRFTRARDVRVVFVEHGGDAVGIFKPPVSTYNHSWTSVCFTQCVIPFLPDQAYRAAFAACGAKRLFTYLTWYRYHTYNTWHTEKNSWYFSFSHSICCLRTFPFSFSLPDGNSYS